MKKINAFKVSALILALIAAVFVLYIKKATIMPQNMIISCIYGNEGFDAESNFCVVISANKADPSANKVRYAPYGSNIVKDLSLTDAEVRLYLWILRLGEKTEFKLRSDMTEREYYSLPVHIAISESVSGDDVPIYKKYDNKDYYDSYKIYEYYSDFSASKYAGLLAGIIYFGFYLREFYWWLLPLMLLLVVLISGAAAKSAYTKKMLVYITVTVIVCVLSEMLAGVFNNRLDHISAHYMWGRAGFFDEVIRKLRNVQYNAHINFVPVLTMFAAQLFVLAKQKTDRAGIVLFGVISAFITALIYFMFQTKRIFNKLLGYMWTNMFLTREANPHVYIFWGCIVFILSFLPYVLAGLVLRKRKSDTVIKAAACAFGLSMLIVFPCFGIKPFYQ